MDNLFQLGEASHISIGVKDIQNSLEFYKQLAFHTVTQGKEPSPWMHISDGSILISLNQDKRLYMGLTYYASDMEKRVAMLKEKGIRFREYGDLTDQKQNWWFTTPDGFHVQLIKSETKFIFQPEGKTLFDFPEENFIFPEKYPNMQCGIFGEIFHRINDLKKSITFWETLGFETKQYHRGPHPYAVMVDKINIIGLHQNADFVTIGLNYFAPDMGRRIQKLKDSGVARMRNVMGTGGGTDNVAITTPNGHTIYLFSF